uniref:GTP-binding protein 128up-like n=1 Tax=Dermatophagoides pteronyssinus TaxID=6956 RepID=A0A6P6Y4M5_DERPT|nr:GTP-binding protein 128up-like [Dermatophagoides pteronyssinus]
MSTLQKIAEIESEIARTQKNKATNFHIGLLKAKLARLRQQLIEGASKSSGGTGEGFDVMKTGDSRIGFIGFPSVGKSTLLTKLTGQYSEAADYEFTTLTCVPGVLKYKGARIQLLDLPGIIEGAVDGKGRGKQVIAVARTCNLIYIILDCSKPYRLLNCSISFKCDPTADELIDAIEGNRIYVPCIYVMNKVDSVPVEELDVLAKLPNTVFISAKDEWNLDGLVRYTWSRLELIRVYTKPQKKVPDFTEPVILRRAHRTVADFCNRIHRKLLSELKYAMVWGSSVKHNPQKVGKDHELADEDVVQICK